MFSLSEDEMTMYADTYVCVCLYIYVYIYFFFFSIRDNVAVADMGNMQLEAQHAFTHRRQISEDTENLDNRDSPEVKTNISEYF